MCIARSDMPGRVIKSVKEQALSSGRDAFSAAIIMGFIKNLSTEQTAKLGMAAAAFAMKSSTAVNKNICMEGIRCLANI